MASLLPVTVATYRINTTPSGRIENASRAPKHEIDAIGRKVAKETVSSSRLEKPAVKRAKKDTGTVSRPQLEKRAVEIAE
jgi:hypothetical protein